MNENEIREAVEFLKRNIEHKENCTCVICFHSGMKESIRDFISFATQYFACVGISREKIENLFYAYAASRDEKFIDQAVREHKFWLMKKCQGMPLIIKKRLAKLADETSKKQIEEVDKKGLWVADCISNTFDEVAEIIAAALTANFMEGEK